MRLTAPALLSLIVLAGGTPASAQETSAAGPPERRFVISASPILALFEILQAEGELKLGRETTAALGVGYWSFGDAVVDDEVSYLSLDVKGRFYPDEAFQGFAIGGTLGFARVEYVQEDEDVSTEEEATGFAFGVEVSRAWLLGDEQRWFLAAGIGAKRYYFDEVGDDVPLVLPTGRIGFGVAF